MTTESCFFCTSDLLSTAQEITILKLRRRTDVIVDYLGKQYIIEPKIWHGNEYNTNGEQQLSEYLDYYHIDKGYLLSFNLNKNKQSGMHTIELNGRTIIEAVV